MLLLDAGRYRRRVAERNKAICSLSRCRSNASSSKGKVINWRVSQTYYFDIGQNQGQFDPNYYSAIFARGPGGTAERGGRC